MVLPISPFHAVKIRKCFDTLGITGDVLDYKTVYRATTSNFICNVHTGKKGMRMELQNSSSDPGLAQILTTIAEEIAPEL